MRLFEAFRLSRMLPQYWLSGYLPVSIPFWAGRRNRTFLHFLNIRNQQCQVTPLTDCLAFSQILVFRLPLIFKIFFWTWNWDSRTPRFKLQSVWTSYDSWTRKKKGWLLQLQWELLLHDDLWWLPYEWLNSLYHSFTCRPLL